jgi:starvation-inducible DNA-binding protein
VRRDGTIPSLRQHAGSMAMHATEPRIRALHSGSAPDDLPGSVSAQAIGVLVRRRTDCVDLQALIRRAKWNLTGSASAGLRRGLTEIEADAEDYAELLAERAVQLGWTGGGGKLALVGSTPTEEPAEHSARAEPRTVLLSAIASFDDQVRTGMTTLVGLGDVESAGILAEISRIADTWRWCLEGAGRRDRLESRARA